MVVATVGELVGDAVGVLVVGGMFRLADGSKLVGEIEDGKHGRV